MQFRFIHIMLLLGFILSAPMSIAAKSEWYYRLHPDILQKELHGCLEQNRDDEHCQSLKKTALLVNALAYELRLDPQAYGQKILALQEAIAQKSVEHSNEHVLHEEQQQLKARLAIVKWLESPER